MNAARARFPLTLAIASMSGFIALSYEILWYRAFAFVSWGAPGVFGLLLGAYLTGVALGSLGSRRFCDDAGFERMVAKVEDADREILRGKRDGARLRALAAFVALADATGFVVIPALARLATVNWLPSFAIVALSAGLMGAVLPLVAHFGIAADDRAGARLSYVYLANIVGSSLGSFLTGFLLMDVWSTSTISLLLAGTGLAMAALLLVAAGFAARAGAMAKAAPALVFGVGMAAAVLAAPSLFHDLYERLLFKNKYDPAYPLTDVVENRHGVIVVNDRGQIYGGGAYDGAFNTSLVDDKNAIERAFAIPAMHPAPRRVLMIGLSSGSWAQVVAHLKDVESLTIVEINPGYLGLIAKFPAVRSLLENPKVHIVIDDGRRWLLRHPDDKFDFIVMNTTWHWRSNITNLLSREFLGLARAHLLPGGIHYFNTTSSWDAQLTAAETFPYALRVRNFMAVSDAPFGFDKARWKDALVNTPIDGVPSLDLSVPFQRVVLDKFLAFGDTFGVPFDKDDPDDNDPVWNHLEGRDAVIKRTLGEGATIITDDNMECEWRNPLRFQLEAE